MVYFIQSGNRIKIGRGNVLERLRIAKTWTPDEPRLLMAIHVEDELFAEAALHYHFRDQRTNNEWFEINFTSAFRALLDLKLIPDASQPILELPVVPPIHPEFRRWFLEFDWRSVNAYSSAPSELTDEDRASFDENIEYLWHRHWPRFCSDLKKSGSVDQMIKDSQVSTPEETEEFYKNLRNMLKSNFLTKTD